MKHYDLLAGAIADCCMSRHVFWWNFSDAGKNIFPHISHGTSPKVSPEVRSSGVSALR